MSGPGGAQHPEITGFAGTPPLSAGTPGGGPEPNHSPQVVCSAPLEGVGQGAGQQFSPVASFSVGSESSGNAGLGSGEIPLGGARGAEGPEMETDPTRGTRGTGCRNMVRRGLFPSPRLVKFLLIRLQA